MQPQPESVHEPEDHAAADAEGAHHRGGETPRYMKVRDDDLEPHAGLRYIARLFKLLAILLLLLLIAEAVLGLIQQGQAAIPTLLVEATRLIVFAGLLWGAADMALMLIESNHDLRATRILVGRLNGHIEDLERAVREGSTRAAPVTGRDRPHA